MEKKEIIKRLLLEPLGLMTLTPFMLGVVLGMGAWAAGLESGIALAAGVILMLISAGVYLNRLILGWNDNYEKIVSEFREKVEKERDRDLDKLYRELRKDGDSRTEILLKDLRTLTKALLNEQSEVFAFNSFDIIADVDKLFQRSVDYLKESLQLWDTAREMENAKIKGELLNQREMLIKEVEESLANLGKVLGAMKKTAVNFGSKQHLSELRQELNARLKIAEEVEQRMSTIRNSTVSPEDEEKYLKYAD